MISARACDGHRQAVIDLGDGIIPFSALACASRVQRGSTGLFAAVEPSKQAIEAESIFGWGLTGRGSSGQIHDAVAMS